MGLFLTFLTSLCFLLGYILNTLCHDKKNINCFAVALAFVVLLNVIFLDIIPEIRNDINLLSIGLIIMGIGVLKILDLIVPHHHHEHKEKEDNLIEHNDHIFHVSIITVLALSLHNILESAALYNVTSKDFKSGLFMALGIALHNIPLGLQIVGGLQDKKVLYLVLLSLSGIFGGLIALILGDITPILEHLILCFTLGMLIYLVFFELLIELWHTKDNKYTFYGIIMGIVIIFITMII